MDGWKFVETISGWQKPIVRGPHLMVMRAVAIDLRGEWTTHSARGDKRPFVCKRSRDGGKGGGGEGGQHLLWILISASTALLLVLALVVLVLAFLVFTRGE